MAAVTSHDFLNPPTQPGDMGTLSHYRVIDELGKGGMGYVFRAEDIRLKRSVALKVMNRKIAATPNSRRRFIHEARAMAAVHHDNVATIFDVGESNKTPYMAMEMLKGSTIEAFNESDERLEFGRIIEYARQMSRGLAAAHAQGIVHRDIKPANIWIEKEKDRIKILDFGLALASTPVDHLAGRGAVIGTPGYLSPEQARSEPLDDRSDLYSLGVVLYELCTGKLPIQSDSVPGQLISILAHRPTPINELNPEIPQPLCDLIHRLLRKEPRMRPSSAKFLVEELDRVESECNGEDEVAATINRLQAGLGTVLGSDESLFDDLPETVPDPLAAVPGPSASSAATQVAPATRPVAAKKVVAQPAPNWQAYWPLAAILALVLIALPVMTFMFSGKKRTDSIVIADSGESYGANDFEAEDPSYGAENGGVPIEQESNRPNQNQRGDGGRDSNADGPSEQPRRNGQRGNGGSRSQQQRSQQERDGGQSADNGLRNSNPGAGQGQGEERPRQGDSMVAGADAADGPKDADMTTGEGGSPPSEPTADGVNNVASGDPVDQPKKAEMKWVTITTSDGRGADAMVQNGNSQKQGLKPSFGIGMRKGIETHHAYLRFDLASVEEVRRQVKVAGIMLTPVKDQLQGTVIRVYGIDGVGMWPEAKLEWKNSYSTRGLTSLPLLAELTVAEKDLTNEAGRPVLRISSPKFAEFISGAEDDTITLVLAGSGKGAEVVRFMSRESPAARPPRLLVQVPKDPPEDKENRGQGRNRRDRQ